MTPKPSQPVLRLRSVFISDVHLGLQGLPGGVPARLPAPRRVRAGSTWSATSSTCWSLQRSFYWPQAHNDVIQKHARARRKQGHARGLRAGQPRPSLCRDH
ncbi:MAG: hypothetical protein MZW92_78615 [Comamonadaceae bacterium]|nr:hypothetical protein [Comamonadaceae bacterium]